MHAGDTSAVTGHTNESHESFVAGLCHGFDGSTWAMSLFPFVLLNQIVKLDQVDLINAESR